MTDWSMYSDAEIMKLYQLAQETCNGRAIKSLKEEMSRRNRDE